jgi:hypothetical protein
MNRSLTVTKPYTMKMYGEVKVYIHVFLASALVSVVSFTLRPLYHSGEGASG